MYTNPNTYQAGRVMMIYLLVCLSYWHAQMDRVRTRPNKYRTERPVGIDLTAMCEGWHAQWTLTYNKPNDYQTTCAMGTPSGRTVMYIRLNKYRTERALGSICALFVMVVTPIGPLCTPGVMDIGQDGQGGSICSLFDLMGTQGIPMYTKPNKYRAKLSNIGQDGQ